MVGFHKLNNPPKKAGGEVRSENNGVCSDETNSSNAFTSCVTCIYAETCASGVLAAGSGHPVKMFAFGRNIRSNVQSAPRYVGIPDEEESAGSSRACWLIRVALDCFQRRRLWLHAVDNLVYNCAAGV